MDVQMNATDKSLVTAIEDELDKGWSVGGIENSSFVRSVYGLIAVFGIVGNALVCFVLLRVPALRTRTSQFIINLAVNDFATSVLVIPFHLFPYFPSGPTSGFAGQLFCRLVLSKFILWVSIMASICSLVAITVERYFAVLRPLEYKSYFTTRFTIIVVVVCWIVSLSAASFYLLIYGIVDGQCVYIPLPTVLDHKIVGVFVFIIMYALPITINMILHIRIIRSLRRQAKMLDNGLGQEGQQNRWQLKTARELQKMFLIVLLVFMLCWAPNQFIFFAHSLGAKIDFTSQYYHFSVIIALCNSCVNPFIYVFKNKAFRSGVLQALGFRQTQNRVHTSGTGTGVGPSSTRGTISTTA